MYDQEELKLLLYVWSAGSMTRGELSKRLGKKSAGSALANLLQKLQNAHVLDITQDKRKVTISLTAEGKATLSNCLYSSDFQFAGNQGARLVNTLMKWFRENATPEVKSDLQTITTYEEFKEVALETYDRIKRQYNYIKLVPVYRIRRELGDRVDRDNFNQWMWEMHRTDVMRLYGGKPDDATEDTIRDSIYNEIMRNYYYDVERM